LSPLKSATAMAYGVKPEGNGLAGRNVPLPAPSRNERLVPSALLVTRSSLPSPVKSARTREVGSPATGMVWPMVKAPSPPPSRTVMYDWPDKLLSATTRSILPSPSRSPAASQFAPGPAGMPGSSLKLSGPVAKSTVTSLCESATAMSGRPSPLKSAITGLPGSLPTWYTTWL
jgi:hypothetical protein